MTTLVDFIEDGLCAQTDPEIFFNEKPNQWNVEVPKRVCRECPVMGLCRDWSVDQPELHGVWGGLSEGERRKIRMGRAA